MRIQLRKRIVLVGGPGAAGKDNVTRGLVEYLKDDGYTAFIMDDELERRFDMKIHEYFAKHGEPAFRVEETKLLTEVVQRRSIIGSLGGGGLNLYHNRMMIKRSGAFVGIVLPSFEITYARAMRQQMKKGIVRPLMQDRSKAEEKYNERISYYEDAADFTVTFDHELPKEEVLRRFIDGLENCKRLLAA